MFLYQDICQVSDNGTLCRVLLSMHASCSEVLDMVAYLRPRKVYPNVIPANSSKEEVILPIITYHLICCKDLRSLLLGKKVL